MDIDPGDVLDDARKAFREEDYETALEKYRWFFENSTLIDSAYHGVRLSYCLGEWSELAKVYPTAKDALFAQKQSARKHFDTNKSVNSFCDYASICSCLNSEEESVRLFLDIHESDNALAKRVFCYVYEPLAKNSEWDICREYLGNGYKQYQQVLEIFDHSIKFSKKLGGDEGRAIEEDGRSHLKKELLWLLNMLAYINAEGEYESAINRMQIDLEKRGYIDLYQEVTTEAPIHNPMLDS